MAHKTKYVSFNERKCCACLKCMDVCHGAIGTVSFLWRRHARIADASLCNGCLQCVKICTAGAFTPLPAPCSP
jgi:uncharacterized Fe-S center protein